MMKRAGRKKPYTEAGIRRVKCVRCGQSATHQWYACADSNLFRPICRDCDVKLNRLALRFMNDPDWKTKIQHYSKT